MRSRMRRCFLGPLLACLALAGCAHAPPATDAAEDSPGDRGDPAGRSGRVRPSRRPGVRGEGAHVRRPGGVRAGGGQGSGVRLSAAQARRFPGSEQSPERGHRARRARLSSSSPTTARRASSWASSTACDSRRRRPNACCSRNPASPWTTPPGTCSSRSTWNRSASTTRCIVAEWLTETRSHVDAEHPGAGQRLRRDGEVRRRRAHPARGARRQPGQPAHLRRAGPLASRPRRPRR